MLSVYVACRDLPRKTPARLRNHKSMLCGKEVPVIFGSFFNEGRVDWTPWNEFNEGFMGFLRVCLRDIMGFTWDLWDESGQKEICFNTVQFQSRLGSCNAGKHEWPSQWTHDRTKCDPAKSIQKRSVPLVSGTEAVAYLRWCWWCSRWPYLFFGISMHFHEGTPNQGASTTLWCEDGKGKGEDPLHWHFAGRFGHRRCKDHKVVWTCCVHSWSIGIGMR